MAGNGSSDKAYWVGDYLVEPRLRTIRLGPRSVRVTPRALAVLNYLADAGGAVVTRSELLDVVWPRMLVSPDALTQCIVELRKAFGDDSKHPTTIETVPKVGFRLLAPVRLSDGDTDQVAGRRRGRFAILVPLVLVAVVGLAAYWNSRVVDPVSPPAVHDRSIAILPFATANSADDDLRSFAEGLHAELIGQLGRLSGLDNVIGRTTMLVYGDTTKRIRDIGRELHVATVLETRIEQIGSEARVVTTLVDAESERAVWSEAYQVPILPEAMLDLQSEMATAIAVAVAPGISHDALDILPSVASRNTRAMEFFIRGSAYFRRSNDRIEDLRVAATLFENATAEDPRFALAWARLGLASAGLHFYGIDRAANSQLADSATRRALEIAPSLGDAHVSRGNFLYRVLGNYGEALEHFAIAEAAMTNVPEFYFWRSGLYRRTGNMELAIADLEGALKRDPLNVIYLRQQHANYLLLRQYDLAGSYLHRIIEIAPDDATAYVDLVALKLYRDGDTGLARAYEQEPPVPGYTDGLGYVHTHWLAAIFDRDYDRALRLLDSVAGDTVNMQAATAPKSLFYARTHRLAGRAAEARSWYAKALDEARAQAAEQPGLGPDWNLIEAEAGLGHGEIAIRLLDDSTRSNVRASAREQITLGSVLDILLPLGETETAAAALEEYFGKPGPWSREGLQHDPRVGPLAPRAQVLEVAGR